MQTPFIRTLKLLTATLAIAMHTAHAEDAANAKSWRVISSGTSSNIEEATQTVIRTPEAWTDWWNQHITTIEVVDGKETTPPPPPVDFDAETLLVATMGTRSSGGYAIEFTGINHKGATLIATLRTTAPDPDGFVTMALTQPFAIIAVPRHNGPVTFINETGAK